MQGECLMDSQEFRVGTKDVAATLVESIRVFPCGYCEEYPKCMSVIC